MADNADFANDLVQEGIDRILAARAAVVIGHSFLFCEGCDDAIPQARREAAPGCTHCTPCQTFNEMKEARYAR